uniref:Neurotransmitter-gated ion-channel ligand-binding domain-containing protein n=1 Tax=Anopheles maculatus TaxID=74869 RepID=A0A182T1Y8_9DIPT
MENRLKSSLLCNGYRADTRPRKDNTQSVNITVAYYVLTYEFEEADDLMKVGVWMELVSSKKRYYDRAPSGITYLYYNPEELPDCANPKCSVAPNGTVTCLPVCSMNAKCDADYSRWPFDIHRCNMWYGTWANSMDEVDIHITNVCLARNSEFKSPKWGVVSLDDGRSVLQSSDKYMYTVLNVEVMLVRQASFEQVAIVGPILILALLNVYTVWLRSSSFERKVLLGLSTFCHFSYLKQLEWTLPYNRDTLPNCSKSSDL